MPVHFAPYAQPGGRSGGSVSVNSPPWRQFTRSGRWCRRYRGSLFSSFPSGCRCKCRRSYFGHRLPTGQVFLPSVLCRELPSNLSALRTPEEKTPLPFWWQKSSTLRSSAHGLRVSLGHADESSLGPDNISHQMMKDLPKCSLNALFKIFDSISYSGSFLPSWREAIVIPLVKQGKEPTNTFNYGPTTLTSCIWQMYDMCGF